MPRVRVLSDRDAILGLTRLGFERIGERGSHVKRRRDSATVIVPDHREVRRGTLAGILQQAGVSTDDPMAGIAH